MLNLLPLTEREPAHSETVITPGVRLNRARSYGILGVTWLSVCIGILLMFDSFVLFGGKAIRTRDLNDFTYYGSTIYLPEREIPLYVFLCAFTVGLQALLATLWKRRFAASPDKVTFGTNSGRNLSVVATVGLAIGTLLLFVIRHLFIHDRIGSGLGALILVMVPIVQLFLFFRSNSEPNSKPVSESILRFLSHRFLSPFLHKSIAKGVVPAETLAHSSITQESLYHRTKETSEHAVNKMDVSTAGNRGSRGDIPRNRPAFKRIDIMMPIALFLMIFVPRPDLLVGHVFVNEHFHHWDFFMVGPAVGYANGLALGTETYSQYGIGWPVVIAKLASILPLGYTNALWVGQIYCLTYYLGLYFFLRLLLKRTGLAAFGTILALYWRHYAWLGNNFPVWELPQNSMLRTPFDVWFLSSLLLHMRTNKGHWLMVASAWAALSLLFETDNGIYLIFVLGLYNLYWIIGQRHSARQVADRTGILMRSLSISLLAGVVLTGVALAGIAVASRGTMWQGAFWRGWLESFIAYPSGVSMLPVSAYRQGILYGMFQIGFYLFAVCYRRERYFEERTTASERLQLWIGLYGLCLAIHYIGRSHPNYLFESSLPLAILVVCLMERLALWADRKRAEGYYAMPRFANRAIAGFIVWIVALQLYNMRNYPSALHATVRQVMKGQRPPTAQLFAPGVGASIPISEKAQAMTYNLLAYEIRQYAQNGKQVAIISNDDTSLYLASGARPWSRYLPLLPNLVTKRQLEETSARLASGTADVVYMPIHDPCEMYDTWYLLVTTDAWLKLRRVTRQNFVLDHITGPYEVYVHPQRTVGSNVR